MAKSALGRGLGNLLKEAKEAPPSTEPSSKPANLSPGMANLLLGQNGDTTTEPASPASPEPKEKLPLPSQRPAALPQVVPLQDILVRRVLQISLICADVILMVLAAWGVLGGTGTFRAVDVMACVLAMIAGAWLSCLAIWLELD